MSQPDDPSPCDCYHAPCIHDRNKTIADLRAAIVEVDDAARQLLNSLRPATDPRIRYPQREALAQAATAARALAGRGGDRTSPLREAAGVAADRIDSLIAALSLTVPPATHLEGLRGALPDIVAELRAALGGDS
jgi:hypothetical protein